MELKCPFECLLVKKEGNEKENDLLLLVLCKEGIEKRKKERKS